MRFSSLADLDSMISEIGDMAQLVVRNIEARVKEKLQRRARRHGRSMEEEVRDILRNAVKDEGARAAGGFGTEFAALFAGIGLETDIPELRGYSIKPPTFD
jgi:antitoxin FitA